MTELKSCPFCGKDVELEKRPLWHGSHGYYGCYKYIIECKHCGCNRKLFGNDTIYNDEEIARENAINAWNKRALDFDTALATAKAVEEAFNTKQIRKPLKATYRRVNNE